MGLWTVFGSKEGELGGGRDGVGEFLWGIDNPMQTMSSPSPEGLINIVDVIFKLVFGGTALLTRR